MAKTYFEKLKDPRWQRKRLEAMEAAEFMCQMCCDSTTTLHVHHKAYFKGREPWEYDIEQLAVVCENCHKDEHASDDAYSTIGSYLPVDGPGCRRDAAVLVCGAFQNGGLDHPLIQKLFPEPWPYLPFQLAIGRTANALEWSLHYKMDFHELLSLPDAINADPEGFKELIRKFVAASKSRVLAGQ